MGDVGLLDHLNATRLALPDERQFITFYVTCTGSTKTFMDLLQLMVNAAESVETAPIDGNSRATQLVDRKSRKKLALKIFEFESTKTYQTESQRLSYQDLNGEEKLIQLCDLLTATYGQPVLFIIDELDRIENTAGLASFLKAASSERLKFLLVGIASNISELLADHQSLERRLNAVRIPLMTQADLGQIVTKAEEYLGFNGVAMSFSTNATIALSKVAAGFPWFVHVLGQQALVDAEAKGQSVVGRQGVSQAIASIVNNQFAQQFADMYQAAVRDSMNREMTLRAFAQWGDVDIPTGEIYRFLSSQLGVGGGSTYRGHLCAPEYGSILFAPAFQKRGLVRFRNEMFKAYVRFRPSIYRDVDSRVRAAWSEWVKP